MLLNRRWILILLSLCLLLAACGGTDTADVDLDATIAAAIEATSEAASADAVAQTDTAEDATETETEAVEPTATSVPPTETPVPTNTPIPTVTPTFTPAATPTPDAPMSVTDLGNGQMQYDFHEDGFSLTTADGWVATQIDASMLANASEFAAAASDELSELFNSDLFRNLIASGMKFYAINTSAPSAESGNPANINVVQQQSVGVDTETYADLLVEQLPSFVTFADGTELERSTVALGDVTAAKLVYVSEIVNPLGVELNLHTTQYVVVQDDVSYVISLTMPVELVDALLADSEAVAESFRFE